MKQPRAGRAAPVGAHRADAGRDQTKPPRPGREQDFNFRTQEADLPTRSAFARDGQDTLNLLSAMRSRSPRMT